MTASIRRAALLEVLLDPGVLAEHVQDDVPGVRADNRAVDRGAEGAGGVPPHLPAEDDLDVLRAADVEVVADERLEEPPCPAGRVEDDSAGDLDLPHRGLPPVPG
jgi:hypothetical protein